MPEIDFKAVEKKWQEKWRESKCFQADVDEGRQKFFITFPYPYVNGAPHVGHSYSCFRADVYARFKRLQGFNVLFPQGFHATGEPILGAVERLRKGDENQFRGFRESGVCEKDLEEFKKGPEVVARYWMKRWKEDLQAAGVSIDWRRSFITTDLTPTYSRFISWQYNSLKKKGFILQGTHPVVYCPHDQSPTGDHDRLIGEGESPVEYTVIKFEFNGGGETGKAGETGADGEKLVLPCATLRPETAFGVTNLWLNPEVKYVKAKVSDVTGKGGEANERARGAEDGRTEIWVVSEAALVKLGDQGKKVEVVGEMDAKALIGKFCRNPATQHDVLVLEASFVSGDNATGVVMSVPAHAPYDFMALQDLKEKAKANPLVLGLPEEAVKTLAALKPLAVIRLEGYGAFPAQDICQKLQIKSQNEREKLEKATSEIYKHEFHKGVLTERCGKPFQGLPVSECKQKIIQSFQQKGWSSNLWETTGEVVCRCTTKCHVKILENQWFLAFSDREWKDLVLEHVERMRILPEEARLQMANTVEWLQNKACARKSGLGTKLPWDSAWIVETLSDSTIYMAYYTLARIINEKNLKAENLPDEVFDFVFLGEGNEQEILEKSKLDKQTLHELKDEFEYFYPVDLRSSGKDLLQNHLIFFLFHHAALFMKAHWPQGIAVNGYVTVEGEKMSKSKANFIPLRSLLEKHGADLVRINMVAAGENMDDADWKEETLSTYKRLLEFLSTTAESCANPEGNRVFGAGRAPDAMGREEQLLESRLHRCMERASEAFERLEFRTACHYALVQSCHALKTYLQRTASPNPQLVRQALQDVVLMAAPFCPHACEEIWSRLGNQGFASLASFPQADENKLNEALEQEEKILESVLADVQHISELRRIRPKTVRLFVAQAWKRRLLLSAILQAKQDGHFDVGAVLKKAFLDEELKNKAVEVQEFVKGLAKAVNYYKQNPLPEVDEFKLLSEQKAVLEKLLGAVIEVHSSEEALAPEMQAKAKRAAPFKPAILLE